MVVMNLCIIFLLNPFENYVKLFFMKKGMKQNLFYIKTSMFAMVSAVLVLVLLAA